MTVEVILPYAGADPAREAARAWVERAYATELPDYRIHIARFDAEPWCKAAAVMPALHALDGDALVVIADADVWCDQLPDAVAHVAEHGGWARPHWRVVRLTEAATAMWIGGSRDPELLEQFDRRPYRGEDGGGIIVARRSVLLDTPFDRRFTGWGQEDSAIGAALHTLHGEAWVGEGDLVHLWHPPAPRLTPRKGTEGGWQLWLRYAKARARLDRPAMRHLLAEAWPT